jgi:hypothetical protein
MTEEQWLACDEMPTMIRCLESVRGQARKLRLFGCACCRRIWSLIPHDLNRQAVLCVEEYPEDVDREKFPQGVFSHPELNRALVGSSSVEDECAGEPAYWAVKYLGRSYYKVTPASAGVGIVVRAQQARGEARSDEAAAQADLFRDVFGNPFRPVSLDTNWLTPTVVSIVQAAYDERTLPSGELESARLVPQSALDGLRLLSDSGGGHAEGDGRGEKRAKVHLASLQVTGKGRQDTVRQERGKANPTVGAPDSGTTLRRDGRFGRPANFGSIGLARRTGWAANQIRK